MNSFSSLVSNVWFGGEYLFSGPKNFCPQGDLDTLEICRVYDRALSSGTYILVILLVCSNTVEFASAQCIYGSFSLGRGK